MTTFIGIWALLLLSQLGFLCALHWILRKILKLRGGA